MGEGGDKIETVSQRAIGQKDDRLRAIEDKTSADEIVLPNNSIQKPGLVRWRRDSSRFVSLPRLVDIAPAHQP